MALGAAGVCLLVYALATQYGVILKRPTAPLVLGTVLLEGVFVFGGLSYLASSLTDRFGINYAHAGLMVAGFGCGGLIYSVSAKKLVIGLGELGVLLLGGVLLGVGFVSIAVMPYWQFFVPAVVVLGMGYYTMHGTLQTRATEPRAAGARNGDLAVRLLLLPSVRPRAQQLLGSILKSNGYAAAFIVAGAGLFTTAFVSSAAVRSSEGAGQIGTSSALARSARDRDRPAQPAPVSRSAARPCRLRR